MAKRSISPPHTKCDIDWNKCFICQRGKSGPKDLTCPAIRDGQGYSTFVTDVETFNDLVDTEEQFDLTLINEGEGPERTLKHRKASWHQSCRIKYSKTKIQRLEAQREQRRLKTPADCSTSIATYDQLGNESQRQSKREGISST